MAVNVLYDANYDYPQYHRTDALAVVLAVLAIVPVLAVWRWPWAVLPITTAAVLAATVIGYPRWVSAMGPMLAAGLVLAQGRIAARALAPIAVALAVWLALRGDPGISGAAVAAIGYAVVAVAVGLAARAVRQHSS
jgi:hypothetical protein